MNQALVAVLEGIESKKAQDLVLLDISEVSSFTDYFILCTGASERQNRAIADAVEEKAKEKDISPAHIEGYQNAEWILMDFLDFVVHIFSQASRNFYDLERLWRDGKRVDLTAISRHADEHAGRLKESCPPEDPVRSG